LAKDSGYEVGFGWFNAGPNKREEDMGHIQPAEVKAAQRRALDERARLGPLPGGGKAVLKVSIPVRMAGNTGQSGEWVQGGDTNYDVTFDGDFVVLRSDGADNRVIKFNRKGLEAALRILEDYSA
jgi:hypothetical protein